MSRKWTRAEVNRFRSSYGEMRVEQKFMRLDQSSLLKCPTCGKLGFRLANGTIKHKGSAARARIEGRSGRQTTYCQIKKDAA